jgi:hypothetical protein
MPSAVIHDLGQVLRKQIVAPSLITTTSTVTNIDMVTGDGRCTLFVDVGVFTGTSVSIQVQECDTTNGTYANITGAATVSVTTGTQVLSTTFDRNLRSVGAVVTVSGTTIGYSASVVEALKTF